VEGEGFLELAGVGVAGGEAGEVGGILAGTEVILVQVGVVVLAGELEGVAGWIGVLVGF